MQQYEKVAFIVKNEDIKYEKKRENGVKSLKKGKKVQPK